jgi:hypothetical protein
MVEFAITRTFNYQCEWTVLGTYILRSSRNTTLTLERVSPLGIAKLCLKKNNSKTIQLSISTHTCQYAACKQ